MIGPNTNHSFGIIDAREYLKTSATTKEAFEKFIKKNIDIDNNGQIDGYEFSTVFGEDFSKVAEKEFPNLSVAKLAAAMDKEDRNETSIHQTSKTVDPTAPEYREDEVGVIDYTPENLLKHLREKPEPSVQKMNVAVAAVTSAKSENSIPIVKETTVGGANPSLAGSKFNQACSGEAYINTTFPLVVDKEEGKFVINGHLEGGHYLQRTYNPETPTSAMIALGGGFDIKTSSSPFKFGMSGTYHHSEEAVGVPLMTVGASVSNEKSGWHGDLNYMKSLKKDLLPPNFSKNAFSVSAGLEKPVWAKNNIELSGYGDGIILKPAGKPLAFSLDLGVHSKFKIPVDPRNKD